MTRLGTTGIARSSVLRMACGLLIAVLLPLTAAAQEKKSGGNLASQATDPTAALIQLQIQNQFIPSSHKSSGYANTFIIQPVIPIALGKDSYFQNIITRTTLPIVTTPNFDGPVSGVTGLGDTSALAFAIHKWRSGSWGLSWGPGLATIIPTATDKRTGAGKWSLGPAWVFIAGHKNVFEKGDAITIGTFGYNVWSIAGPNGRMDVNKMFAAPVLVYHFNELNGQKGWYAGWTDELWSFNWKKGGKPTMPVGARLGRVFSIGKQSVNVFVQSDYWAVHAGPTPRWDIKLNVTFLFPE